MTDKPEFEKRLSRRKMGKWLGQVVTSISLASIGIGLTDPKNAFAQPNCHTCDGCEITACRRDPACYPKLLFEYKQFYGCVNFGQPCPYYYVSNCVNSGSACNCT